MTLLQPLIETFTTLENKVVVLTGGASGIGKSAVELFASYGAKVVFGDVQDDIGDAVAKSVGSSATFQHCDASSYSDQLALFDTAARMYGRVDIAVSNAGIGIHRDIFAPDSDWTQEPSMREVDINLKGALYTSRIALGHMRRSKLGGDIVIVSSVSGFKESKGMTTYTASKHGSLGIVRGLHTLVGPEDIRVNIVCPWMTKTPMAKGFQDSWINAGLPSNEPEDVARAILLCASANRAEPGKGHGNAALPFAGKILFVGGGRCYEIEDNIQALEPTWLGKDVSKALNDGNAFLNAGLGFSEGAKS